MNIIDYLKENHSAMRSGLPIELRDLIDERSVSAGSYESMVEFLGQVGLEHVKNATFVLDDLYNDENRIILYYVKEIKEYDEFDLRQFAAKVMRLEKQEASLEDKLADASVRSEETNSKNQKIFTNEELIMNNE